MNSGGVPEHVTLVKERFADSKVPFCGDAHDQEGLPAEKDILDRVEEVGENEDVELMNKLGEEVS